MTEQLDAQGEARDALSSVVADFGPSVLSNSRMLGSRMSDLLPDLPKERELLATAAEADVAGELQRHVQEQHLDPDTAVQLVAGSLTDRKSIDPASSMWVTTEYAQALGYSVRPGAMPPPAQSSPRPTPPPPQETVTSYGQYGQYGQTAPQQEPTIGAPGAYAGYSQPPPAGGGYSQPPPAGGGYYSQPQPPPGGGGYYPPPAGGQAPPPGVPQAAPPWEPPRSPKKSNRGLIYVLGAAAAVVVIGVVAIFASGVLSSKPKPPPTTPPPTHHTTPATPRTSPPPGTNTLAAGVAPLVQLLPSDVNAKGCTPKPKTGWATPGLVSSLYCYDSAFGKGGIYAYQMDSFANYQASWANFNTWAGFKPTASSGCPPSGGNAIGAVPWEDTGSGGHSFFPTASGQILECGLLGTYPTYAWSFPSEDAYIIAQGNPGTTLSALDTWWTGNSEPLASPSPSAP